MRQKKESRQHVRIAIWMRFINMAKPGRGNSGFYVLYAAGNLPGIPEDLKSGTGRSALRVER